MAAIAKVTKTIVATGEHFFLCRHRSRHRKLDSDLYGHLDAGSVLMLSICVADRRFVWFGGLCLDSE